MEGDLVVHAELLVPAVYSSSGCAVQSAVGGRGDADVPPDQLEGSPQVREERHPPSHRPQPQEEWQVSEMYALLGSILSEIIVIFHLQLLHLTLTGKCNMKGHSPCITGFFERRHKNSRRKKLKLKHKKLKLENFSDI